MKKIALFLFFVLSFGSRADKISAALKTGLCFTENKGQVGDQNSKPRPDILFGGTDGRLSFHLKQNGISYQQYRIDSWTEETDFKNGFKYQLADKVTSYRLDVNWLNVNSNVTIIKGEALPGYTNYYNDVCPNGALEVRSYKDVIYKNVYNGIDLKWYEKDGHLKYDYLVSANTNYDQIQLEFNGAKKLFINAKGELVIETPLGRIIEQAPYVTQNNKVIKAQWKIKNNIVSFKLSSYNSALPLIIDPGVRQWGTYYGGNQTDVGQSCAVDPLGNVYLAGYTTSAGGTIIATVGSHQNAYSGSGLENAMLIKFTTTGVRLWGTYYGGNVREVGMSCSVDNAGNVFMSGNSVSSNGTVIATVGSHQPLAGGNWDAFLVKFNSNGVRQWGTYYGGSGGDFGTACAATKDGSGDVYLAGRTDLPTSTVIATPGSHQSTSGTNVDCFLVKFNASGVRQWGTYYGDDGSDNGNACATDVSGNVFLIGQTSSSTSISTPGCHQPNIANFNNDAFVAKFNSSGVRQWGTYYGGTGDDRGSSFCIDAANGSLYLGGKTSSSDGNSIATDGSHQNTNGGGPFDAFLVKFNALGVRQWGTYYGGTGDDAGQGCAVNILGYVYLLGLTTTSNNTIIATPGSHQPVSGGGMNEAFLVQFTDNGSRLWGTFYGDSGYDLANGCAVDNNSNVYFAGLTDCTGGTIIATPGSHQPIYGGASCDAFIVKFFDCASPPAPANVSSPNNQFVCTGSSVTLSVNGIGTINWFNVPNGGASLGTGSAYVTPVLSTGTYTFYAEANTCTNSVLRGPVIVTVNPLPNIFVTTSNTLLCAGQTATLFSSGVVTHTWNTGANTGSLVVSPTLTTTYTITGTDANGCTNSSSITQSVTLCPVGIPQLTTNGSQIVIFPNPANNFVLFTGMETSARITVYNSLGQIVLDESNEALKNRISLVNFSNGIYFIKIDQGNKPETIKLIKQGN